MDAGFLRGLYTVLMFVLFIGIVWWAWSARRKADFEDAANLPLEDDKPLAANTARADEAHEGVKRS